MQKVAEILERSVTHDGRELVLQRVGTDYEMLCDGELVVASAARRSEQALAELGLAPLGRDDMTVLLAGLGMGYTLRALLDLPGVERVDVIEVSEAVVDWNRRYLGALSREALADPRVYVHVGDLLGFEKKLRFEPLPGLENGWLALVLDVDNGPSWPTRPGNQAIYTDDGLLRLMRFLRPGGVLSVWSAERDLAFVRRLQTHFVHVAELGVPIEIAGSAGIDYVYRGRRPPSASAPRGLPQA